MKKSLCLPLVCMLFSSLILMPMNESKGEKNIEQKENKAQEKRTLINTASRLTNMSDDALEALTIDELKVLIARYQQSILLHYRIIMTGTAGYFD